MSETWRVKRYYRPRVLVPVTDLASETLPDGIYCLTGPQVGLLKTLLAYAHRRVTWVSEYRETDYLTPTTEEWDNIEAFVADLEETLMTNCCELLVEALGDIDTTLQANGAQLATIATKQTSMDVTLSTIAGTLATMGVTLDDIEAHLPDIVTALECICSKQETIILNVTVDPSWIDYPGATDAFDWSTRNPVTNSTPQVDEDACNLAQAWYHAGFEWMTELVLPALRFGFDKLIPAAAAAIATWTGGVALPVAIGVYAMAELIQELLELGYDAAEANLENWLYNHKQDIVCPLYLGLKDGGTSADLWNVVQTELVDPSPDLSAGDKFMIGVVMKYWGLGAAQVAKAQNSAWYQSIVTPGYCADCPEEPVIGSDWWALPIGEAEGLLHIDHPSGGYWQPACFNYDLPDGHTCVGMVYEVLNEVGDCQLSRNDAPTCGCPNATLWPNSSGDSTVGHWYAYAPFTHNNGEAKAALAPGAGEWTSFTQQTSVVISAGFRTGWNCTGSVDIQVKYLVFTGTTPP